MRITPSKWDAEYAWLRNEEGIRALQADPKVRARKGVNWTFAIGSSRPTALGMALQALGAVVLGILAVDGHLLSLLPLAALIGGEVIFISSLEHKGERSAGDH
ncbi:MAG: hypothetical protein AB9819_00980 [Methanomassiliicoccales archaeon]